MRTSLRQLADRSFTSISGLSVALMVLLLVLILGPMLLKGVTAVFFRGTVEFRRLQLVEFGRGKAETVTAELDAVNKVREEIYKPLDRFARGIDTAPLAEQARDLYRRFGDELRFRKVDVERYTELRRDARDLRQRFSDAVESTDRAEARGLIEEVLAAADRPEFADSALVGLFDLARGYQRTLEDYDPAHRSEYLSALNEVQGALASLLGPRREEPTPKLIRDRYGATRWDMAQKALHKLYYAEQWLEVEPGEPLVQRFVPRSQAQFAGTALEGWFDRVRELAPEMLHPRFTMYWHYFTDDSTPGYYFGGVGPEVLGTLLLTVLTMVFAIPLGITSAAYLVEVASDNLPVRVIRMCINTLAGVPSIVFGLFGLAFFVVWMQPRLGLEPKPSILAASMTLAVLVLPVIIRASEEAIRAVPTHYKEASLALGAGRFRTFMIVSLPAALPGIMTGIILSLSRAAGETAPILITGAIAAGPIPRSLTEPTRALPYACWNIAVADDTAPQVPHNQFGMVMTLILLVLILNIIAIFIRSRTARKLKGY